MRSSFLRSIPDSAGFRGDSLYCDLTRGNEMVARVATEYYKRDFWIKENLNYAKPHFRLEKAARVVNRIAGGKECDLLDVGCGPAALMHLLHHDIPLTIGIIVWPETVNVISNAIGPTRTLNKAMDLCQFLIQIGRNLHERKRE
jgi:hypothetical protein